MDQHATTQATPEKINIPALEYAPLPHSIYERPSEMTIRVYDYCTEHGAHTDPELQQQGYTEQGI